jgi:SnoaL-like domain
LTFARRSRPILASGNHIDHQEDAMSTVTTTKFDLERFKRATEERDASTQLSMYAPEATVTVIDPITQPRSPRILSGREQVKGWIEEVAARDMTHSVGHTVEDEDGAAYMVSCRYPDGTNVLCSTVLELEDGAIARQTVVQVWDEGA